jgi:hypothetical protein
MGENAQPCDGGSNIIIALHRAGMTVRCAMRTLFEGKRYLVVVIAWQALTPEVMAIEPPSLRSTRRSFG